jgi:hypothetical protein
MYGGESNRPATNFPRISVDTNWVDYLVEKSGLDVEPRGVIEGGPGLRGVTGQVGTGQVGIRQVGIRQVFTRQVFTLRFIFQLTILRTP